MSMTFLKSAKQLVGKRVLGPRFALHHSLSGWEPARPLDVVHASDLTNREKTFCARYYALADTLKHKPKDQWLTTSQVLTFRIGRDFQDAIVHYLADVHRCVGDWRCLACKLVHHFQKRPNTCLCGCDSFKPIEIRFVSAKTGASFGCDCLFVEDDELIPVEIKTIKDDEYKDLKTMLSEHRVRTNLGLRILDEDVNPVHASISRRKAYVLYGVKQGYGNVVAEDDLKPLDINDKWSPLKQFVLERKDDEDTEKCCHRAGLVKAFRDGTGGMPEGCCMTANSPRAKRCDLKAPCWSGKYPAA